MTKGELREEDITAAFRPHLASRYELFKGVLVNASGAESDPQDLILLDSYALAPLLGSANTRVVPVEGVVGTIQIKSIATNTSIHSAVSNVASAKKLLSQTKRYGRPLAVAEETGLASTTATFFGGLLFLSRDGKVESLAEVYAEAVMALDPRLRPDAPCIVDDFTILWGNPSNGPGIRFAFRGEEAETPLMLIADEDNLLFFYLSLLEHLRAWITPPFNWMEYVFGPNSTSSTFGFRYMYWYD